MHNFDENIVITQDNSENKNMEFVVECDTEFMNNVNSEIPTKPDMKEVLQHLSELESEKQEIINNLQKEDLDEKNKINEENLLNAINIMIKNINEYIKKEE